MARRLNYTKRLRILHEHVRIQITQVAGGVLAFDAKLDLGQYGFPTDESAPKVFVEAYRRASASWMRFDFGTTSAIVAPEDRSLSQFDVPEGILFRVKVTKQEGVTSGRLLAHADRIRPQLPGDFDRPVQPLIQHMAASDLGDELWRVDFSGDLPLLKINSRVPMGVDQFLIDPRLRAVFAPAVMRQVLTRTLIIEKYAGDEEDEEDWRQRWLKFAVRAAGGDPPDFSTIDDLEEAEAWIDRAVEGFSRQARLQMAFSSGDWG